MDGITRTPIILQYVRVPQLYSPKLIRYDYSCLLYTQLTIVSRILFSMEVVLQLAFQLYTVTLCLWIGIQNNQAYHTKIDMSNISSTCGRYIGFKSTFLLGFGIQGEQAFYSMSSLQRSCFGALLLAFFIGWAYIGSFKSHLVFLCTESWSLGLLIYAFISSTHVKCCGQSNQNVIKTSLINWGIVHTKVIFFFFLVTCDKLANFMLIIPIFPVFQLYYVCYEIPHFNYV